MSGRIIDFKKRQEIARIKTAITEAIPVGVEITSIIQALTDELQSFVWLLDQPEEQPRHPRRRKERTE